MKEQEVEYSNEIILQESQFVLRINNLKIMMMKTRLKMKRVYLHDAI